MTAYFKIYFRTSPGAGTFKAQYQNSAGAWTDVTGYTAVSADFAAGLSILTIPVPENVREYIWRVVGVSGTVKICELGVLNDSGLVFNCVNEGGTDLAKAMDATTGFPAADFTTMIGDMAPSLASLATKDDIDRGGVPNAGLPLGMTLLQNRLDAYSATLEMVYTGTYSDGLESVNLIVRNHAIARGKLYFDYYMDNAAMLAAGYLLAGDLVHCTAVYHRVIGHRLVQSMGLGSGPIGRVASDSRVDLLEARITDLTERISALAGAFSSVAVGGNGATALSTLSGSGVGSIAVTQGGRSYVTPVVTVSAIGGVGSGATATAALANGVITSITVTAAGSGYTSPPRIVITDGAGANLTSGNTQGNILNNLNQLNVAGLNAAGASPTLRLTATASNVTTLEVARCTTNGVHAKFFDSDGTTENSRIDNNRFQFVNSCTLGTNGTIIDLKVGGSTNVFRMDSSAIADNTRLLIWDVTAAALVRVSRGAADSGGTGFRVLRIPN
jgi:hypothetical protein